MIVTLGVMTIALLLGAGVLAAANGDVHLSRNDQDHQRAMLAARAGVEDYQFHLNSDPNYWSYCTTSASPTNPRTLPDDSTASYSIELIPATGYSACDPSNPESSMIEAQTSAAPGTFRIKTTGYSRNIKVSLVTTFKRASFADYVYFTNYETSPPAVYSGYGSGAVAWASGNHAAGGCTQYYREGRSSASYTTGTTTLHCDEIQFVGGDRLNGPVGTNDQLNICGSPTFGRASSPQDKTKVADPTGHRAASGCSDNATFTDGIATGTGVLTPPTSNGQLAAQASSSYVFTGYTKIVLGSSGTFTVTNANVNGGTATAMSYPTNGIIYVRNGTCSTTYNPYSVDYSSNGCGTAYVHGTYNKSLTIGSENDIVVDGSILSSSVAGSTGNPLLGLVANNFVRVYHPFSSHTYGNCGSGSNGSGSLSNPEIDAAILSLTGSFIVDNYDCGSSLGNLTVVGSITQYYRGAVGTGSGGSSTTGYLKSYTYDNDLLYREPPHFLDPVFASWTIQRQTVA